MLGDYFSYKYYLIASMLLAAILFFRMIGKGSDRLVYGKGKPAYGWIIVICLTLYIGLRPLHLYGDSWLYSTMFYLAKSGTWDTLYNAESEWLWDKFEYIFIDHSSCQMWYLGIAFFYMFGMAFALRRWFPNNFSTAVVFAITAMSFFAYGTNGIRAGMSSSLAMAGMAFLFGEKRRYTPGALLLFLGASIHNSTYAIFAAAFLALFFHDAKTNTYIWIACVVVGTVFSETLIDFCSIFLGGYRMSYYANLETEAFALSGVRYDFIVYSSVPVIFGWIICVKNGLRDGVYEYILATYTIINAGWALINSIAYSNRFAYLSWFLYPIIIAYPFLNFRFMDNQAKTAGITMLFFSAFTLVVT